MLHLTDGLIDIRKEAIEIVDLRTTKRSKRGQLAEIQKDDRSKDKGIAQ